MFDFKNASEEDRTKEYKKIALKIGDDQFFTKKELKFLPEILLDREQVLAFTSGMVESDTWLVVLTDVRILFLNKGMFYGLQQTAIPLEKINSVTGMTKILFGDITISDGAKTYCITKVLKGTVKTFTNLVQEQVNRVQTHGPQQRSQGGEANDALSQLERFGELLKKNLITREEFNLKKAQLLGLD